MDVQAYERSYITSKHPQDDADTYLLPMIVIRPEAMYKLFAASWQKLYVKRNYRYNGRLIRSLVAITSHVSESQSRNKVEAHLKDSTQNCSIYLLSNMP